MGLQRFRAAAPVYLDGIRRHFTSLITADESRTIASALQKILDAR